MIARRAFQISMLVGLLLALVAPIVAQVHPGEPPDRPAPHPIFSRLPIPTPTPVAAPTFPPGVFATPGGGGRNMGRVFRPAVLGRTVPLSSLPALPPKPAGLGGQLHVMAANGGTMNVNVDPVTCSTTVGAIYNIGCITNDFASNLGAGTYQDYYINANAATATLVGGTYAGGNSDPGFNLTLSNAGTYVLAAFNTGTNTWEAETYIVVGGATYFQTFSDSALNNPAVQFLNANTTTVYVHADNLTPTDSYVLYVEFTSTALQCAFVAPAAVPAAGANQLCNPNNSAGFTAPGGSLTVAWPVPGTGGDGTYSIVLWDKTTNKRLAQRQVELAANTGTATLSFVPYGGNASPAPAPAGTPTTSMAVDEAGDLSDGGFTATMTGLVPGRSYTGQFSDPNGTVLAFATGNASGGGTLNMFAGFGQANAPYNFAGNTYAATLLDNVTKLVVVGKAYRTLGYSTATQFSNPTGTSLVVPAAVGSTVSGLTFTNNAETNFGTGNGDPLMGIYFKTYSAAAPKGITITLPAGFTACGAGCTQETVSDSQGQSWTVQVVTAGAGNNAGSTLTATPVTAGQSLKVNGFLNIPSLTFTNNGTNCTAGCPAQTMELPVDGLTWSTEGAVHSSNAVTFTNANGSVFAAVGHILLQGEANGGAITAGKEAHIYTTRFNQAVYANSQPFVATSGVNNVFALTVKNNSTVGKTITQMQVTLPTAFSPSNVNNFITVDAASPTLWTVVACPGGAPASAFCIQRTGANVGIAGGGASQTIYIDVNPPPATAFSFTDFDVQANVPAGFTVTPDSAAIAQFVPAGTIDSMAIGSYSLDSTLITPLFTPTSEGTATNNVVQISVTNATTGQSPFPDYLDLFDFDLPNANTLTGVSGLPAGFSLLGTTTPSAGVTRYWFGLCAAQFVAATGPPNDGTASCGAASEQNAIAPGAVFSFSANLQTGASNINAIEYAHGANVNGWSAARTFTLTVSAVSAIAGFKSVGTYGSPSAVTSNTQPTIGADTDPTFGNSYVYEIKNTGSNPITTATITIPGKNTSGNNGADAEVPAAAWKITNTPTVSGSGAAGCTVGAVTQATVAGVDGSIPITGCNIAAGQVIDVTFAAQAPYNINYNYQFPTKINGAINASEAWFSDTIVKVVLSGSISIAVSPSNPGPAGDSHAAIICVGCAFDLVLNQIQFRNIPASTTDNYQDPMIVSVYTDAGSTNSWSLTVSADVNPASTTTGKELEIGADNTRSTPVSSGMIFDQPAVTAVPIGPATVQLVHAPVGTTPRRKPFDVLENFAVGIGTEPIAAHTAVLTFTYIAN